MIQDCIDYLTKKIDSSPFENSGFMITERKVLQYAVRRINDKQKSYKI